MTTSLEALKVSADILSISIYSKISEWHNCYCWWLGEPNMLVVIAVAI
jgi:hypothetical protein